MNPSFDVGRVVLAGLANTALLMPAFALGRWLAARRVRRRERDTPWERLLPWLALLAWALPPAAMFASGWTLARDRELGGGGLERRLAKAGFVLALFTMAWFGSAVLDAGRCRQ